MSRLYLSNPCAFFATFCTRCCGRSRRPAFPAPSTVQRDNEFAKLRRDCAVRMRTCAPLLVSVIPGDAQHRTMGRLCAPENLEVPGSALRAAPERRPSSFTQTSPTPIPDRQDPYTHERRLQGCM